jgi:ribosomal protein S27AE
VGPFGAAWLSRNRVVARVRRDGSVVGERMVLSPVLSSVPRAPPEKNQSASSASSLLSLSRGHRDARARKTCQPSRVGREVEDAARPCPMCGATTWILLDGMSTLQALEGGLQALAFSCDRCGFIRWHRKDKVDAEAEAS